MADTADLVAHGSSLKADLTSVDSRGFRGRVIRDEWIIPAAMREIRTDHVICFILNRQDLSLCHFCVTLQHIHYARFQIIRHSYSFCFCYNEFNDLTGVRKLLPELVVLALSIIVGYQ
jgi:hypothetical protein